MTLKNCPKTEHQFFFCNVNNFLKNFMAPYDWGSTASRLE